ncbi:onanonoxo-7-onima-8-eninoihtemlysoneda [Protomyces lactucae-debilis]|uniref:Onanonoxo-7-onima-8-eninoihtemlysoneda n=1 Tax=Protomyces lactucae-debilis TaxID=2754530 RepID=A0A1Y2F0J3_PROLT|nr:onanonoxo-7-onima-8-eninoihtemlysoneda [Protomyces lactucae-debilis]ORY77421.1 onanonoxo-7-onima-8-eninoihtemlysoneda [Protomyces lactucae-debilis]
MRPGSLPVSLRQPAYTLFGANTEVGKTIFSTLLVRALAPKVRYIKPVSTGPLDEADYAHIKRFTNVDGHFFYQFDRPCSPHLAAREHGDDVPSDATIIQKLTSLLAEPSEGITLIETAGGVHSPSPEGNSQLQLLRPLRLPVLLIADTKLGGISTTMSAYESLRLNGFDVTAILGFKQDWGNLEYLAGKLDVPIVQVPPPPARLDDIRADCEHMAVYYDLLAVSAPVKYIKEHLQAEHTQRLARLEEMPRKALDVLWYPFTQHKLVEEAKVTVIDSALQDEFAVYKAQSQQIGPVFDASASWWTQGLGHANSELALTAAYAAGRYGHVILPSAVNEPALALAEKLLETVGKGWASRVYYSDNGATAIEVALKMALKASRIRYAQDPVLAKLSPEELNLGVIGLVGAYHGDTIGAMDAAEPNVYNEQVDWYRTRGLFFDPPQWHLKQGKYVLTCAETGSIEATSLDEVFDLGRINSPLAEKYTAWINREIDAAVRRGQRFGALLFEPILMGAGGMIFVDPLFQHLLVKLVRSAKNLAPPAQAGDWEGLPVITDEVFTGLYRLGLPRTFDKLGFLPDISVNAKLLTGGLVPLAVTLATKEIFEVFNQGGKQDALLHGHSYTAHPVGTSVALKSLDLLKELHKGDLTSIWSDEFVVKMSHHARVEGMVCLGSVLALTLKAEGGYTSLQATGFLDALRADGVLARPLGNVVYFMASQITTEETARRVEGSILSAIDEISASEC